MRRRFGRGGGGEARGERRETRGERREARDESGAWRVFILHPSSFILHPSSLIAPMDADLTVFVTGATGFIGTLLVEALVKLGVRVRALCRRTPEPPPAYEDPPGGPLCHERGEIVRGDVTEPAG